MDDCEATEAYEPSPYSGDDNSDSGFYTDHGADDQSINFSECPLCGVTQFEIASEERLYAANHLRTDVDDQGQLTNAEWTVTEPAWETSTTIRYLCDICGETLPERYQEAIDQALNNYRQEDE